MRYQNWDVLLFPGDCRTPIQEFDTKCFVLDQNVGSVGEATADKHRNRFESMTLVPILTSFVASLERGASFRISIHSWEKPKPSQLLLSYKAPDESALFESRVYLDGVLVAFHREILRQPDWEPGELIGRIKVVIAEGVLRENTPPAPSTARFDRLRDVVAFSFQHAPQGESSHEFLGRLFSDTYSDVLEYSQIAWPNAKMFADVQQKASRLGPIGSRVFGIPGHEAHSHSPQRLPPIASRSKQLSANDKYQKVLDPQNRSSFQPGPSGKGFDLDGLKNGSREQHLVGRAVFQDDDPFVSSHQSPAAIQQWRSMLRSTSHDVSMPDYTSNKSVFNTEMSGVSVERASFEQQVNEANPDEIVHALSPARREQLFKALSASNSPASGIGTRPPTNTPQLSADFKNTNIAHPAGATGSTLGGAHAKLWQEPRQRPRTCSESTSARSTTEPSIHHGREYISPRKPREMSVPGEASLLLPAAPRSQSLRISRHRSASNGPKRKRRSASPSIDIAEQDTIFVVATTPASSASNEEQMGPRPLKPTASLGGPISTGIDRN
ncbi:hypothetical protein CLCR_00592 [Cladophialophora carrionii]|uniref:Uncharacterized protein n=1 Tax=Cladophialophora carrionii TaxID=86049 RepID=A0A1C1C6M3_9EURO|nr:hypothetical protein CLCR_00592 [Cladophialophora carrionii]